MWKKSDFLVMAAAAVGAFGLTLGTMLPRVANATGEVAAAKVLSPVLKVNGCEIQAFTTSSDSPQITQTRARVPNYSGVFIPTGLIPKITIVVKNTSEAEVPVTFYASMDSSRPMGRRISAPENQWKGSYDLVMKPGETREIEVNTQVTAAAGSMYTMTMRPSAETRTAVAALQFSVINDAAGNNVPAQQAAAPVIDPSKPVKFVTQTSSKTPAPAAGQTPVQAAVLAGLKAAKAKAAMPAPAPSPDTLARADTKLP